jgi:hypothetical protein
MLLLVLAEQVEHMTAVVLLDPHPHLVLLLLLVVGKVGKVVLQAAMAVLVVALVECRILVVQLV